MDKGPLFGLSGWRLVYLIIFSNQESALYFERGGMPLTSVDYSEIIKENKTAWPGAE